MDNWDDDTPPPLGSIPDQVRAAQLSNSIIGAVGLKQGELRAATTTSAPAKAVIKDKTLLRRGFFDAKPQKSSKRAAVSNTPSVEVIKAQQPTQPRVKQIPSMFKLEPSEQQQQLDGMKRQLLSALQPTPETIEAVTSDKTLQAGFDDPEVMTAVAEVARDPSAFKKYANNRKVQSFYQAFGQLIGNKLASHEISVATTSHADDSKNRSSPAGYLP